MKPKQFDLIAFDWDGTLFDSTALIARSIQAAAQDLGLPRPSDAQASYVIGLGIGEALAHAVPDLPRERYLELGERYRVHYLAAQHDISLFAGTVPMLQALKARHHWPPARAAVAWTRLCGRWSCAGCSMVRAPLTRPPPSRTRRCCWS